MRGVSREVEHWRAAAASIPDDTLRHDALAAISEKRANIDGAGLFWTLSRTRSLDLMELLVAYEVLADFLDCTSERGARVGMENGLRLHRALIEALDPSLPISDYYLHHPWSQDGGYVRALVEACREGCVRLPSYEAVRPFVRRATLLTQVLALNHEPDPGQRDAALRTWAGAHFPEDGELAWFEWTGAASAWLTILALLALAADPNRVEHDAEATYGAYLPWVSLAGTMLDSYGDVEQDAADAAHSYIGHYPSADAAAQRLAAIISRSLKEAIALRAGHRHLVLASCMIAMYLSKDSARIPSRRRTTTALARAAGPLPRALLPILRAWRVLYKQQAA